MRKIQLNYPNKDESPRGSIGHNKLFFNNDPCKNNKFIGTKFMELFDPEFSYDHSNLFFENVIVNITLNSGLKYWQGQKRRIIKYTLH
ncbi:MAG: hypothetical protein CBC24_09075, partial [Candidatus Pelagibacter sp. TMED64]